MSNRPSRLFRIFVLVLVIWAIWGILLNFPTQDITCGRQGKICYCDCGLKLKGSKTSLSVKSKQKMDTPCGKDIDESAKCQNACCEQKRECIERWKEDIFFNLEDIKAKSKINIIPENNF